MTDLVPRARTAASSISVNSWTNTPRGPEAIGRREATIFAAVCLGGAMLLAFYAWQLRHQDQNSILATLVLGCLIVLVVAIRSAQTPYTLLDPLILFSVAFFFYFVIHVFWLETGHAALGIPGSARPYADALPRSQLYATGAYVTMVVGYCAFRFPSSRRGATTAALETVSPMPLIAIFIFGATANYAGMRLSTDADTTNAFLFRTLGYCALVAFIVTLIRHALSAGSSRRVFGYLAYGFMLPVLIILAFSVARGSRLDAAFVILALFSVRAFFVHPVRLLTIGALAAVVVFVLTPTLESYRARATDEATSAGGAAVRDPDHGVLSSTGWALVNRRTNGGESLALAVEYSPQSLPYQHGRSWKAVAYTFVPHIIWPGKPYSNPTADFSREYGGLSSARGEGLTLAPTVPGDLYLNFGLIGLLSGFFVLGIYIRAVTSFAAPDAFAVALYVALITPLVLVEENVSGNLNLLLTRLAATLCVVGMIRWLSTRAGAEYSTVSSRGEGVSGESQ